MTLLIALIAEHLYEKAYGHEFISTGWIVVIWILHLLSHARVTTK